uniref:Microtubule-associated protein futsch n=1 Tax=Angiostrongylus cantonensis TaxID=6313 RepID=A0A0K0DB86_ANGCA
MAYVPSSDVPSAYLISSDADAVLLDLMGTFVLLDGGAEEILFTKHIRQIDANVISAPTKAALTNAVALNMDAVVPLVGSIPTVKSTGSSDSVAKLLKDIERTTESLPITPTRFNPKYEPIVISKSLRTGRLEMFVLSGDAKEIETLRIAVENGDQQAIEKAASNNGTISVLVWFPTRPSDPIKRILHTGTAPLARIVLALEKAKSLPFLHSPLVSAANAYKENGTHSKAGNSKTTFPLRSVPPTSLANAAKAPPSKRTSAPLAGSIPPRAGVPTLPKSSNAASQRLPKPTNPTLANNRTRVTASAISTTKPVAPATRTGSTPANKKTKTHEVPVQKTVGTSAKTSPVSPPSPVVNKSAEAKDAKTSPSRPPEDAKPLPPTPDPQLTAEANSTSTFPKTSTELDASVYMLDDVVPEINIDAPQDPVSPDSRTPVELVVIPPTPEPVSQSVHSSVDGLPPGEVEKPTDDKEGMDRQPLLVRNEDDGRSSSDVLSTTTTPDPAFSFDHNSVEELDDHTDNQLLDYHGLGHNESPQLSSPGASFISSSDQIPNSRTPSKDVLASESALTPKHDNSPKVELTTEPSISPNANDSLPVLPSNTDIIPAERFPPPSLIEEGRDVVVEGDVPEEFKGPHVPQVVGENGLLDDLEDPPRLRMISMDTDDLKKSLEVAGSTLENVVDQTSKGFDAVVEEVKDVSKQLDEKMLAMQNRSNLIEDDDANHVVKYEETDPIIDSVLETVASDSDRVDLALSNGRSELGTAEKDGKRKHEAPPFHGAPSVPHLSRPLFFELATVPHFNGKCSITDEQSAIEYFTNIRSSNYILHTEDISPTVLDGWLVGKKHWLHSGQKSRLIPTRHHSALQAFVTANASQMEECGLVVNSALECNTISLNTEDGRIDYKMVKIEL